MTAVGWVMLFLYLAIGVYVFITVRVDPRMRKNPYLLGAVIASFGWPIILVIAAYFSARTRFSGKVCND